MQGTQFSVDTVYFLVFLVYVAQMFLYLEIFLGV